MEKRFEQRDPPTKDKVIQIDVGDQKNPKLISISESLSPKEKQYLISLIKEYIDVFGAMKKCLASTLRWQCFTSTSSRMLSQSNNNNDDYDLILWRQSKLRSRNSSNVTSFERNSPDWVANIVPILKKNKKIWGCIDFHDLI